MNRIMQSQDVHEKDRSSYFGDENARSAFLFRVGAQLWEDQRKAEPYPRLISTTSGY